MAFFVQATGSKAVILVPLRYRHTDICPRTDLLNSWPELEIHCQIPCPQTYFSRFFISLRANPGKVLLLAVLRRSLSLWVQIFQSRLEDVVPSLMGNTRHFLGCCFLLCFVIMCTLHAGNLLLKKVIYMQNCRHEKFFIVKITDLVNEK